MCAIGSLIHKLRNIIGFPSIFPLLKLAGIYITITLWNDYHISAAEMGAGKTITLAFTGASGMLYGLRLLELLLAGNHRVYLLYSQAAQIVAHQELQLVLPSRPRDAEQLFRERFNVAEGQLRVFGREEWFAPVASGSNPPDAMVVCPCTMGTLAAIATGLSQKLIERAADVMLKENRKLILVPRETPFSSIHLENMLRLARCGAVILPPNPGFYNQPRNVQDIVDFVVARILDHLEVRHSLTPRWGEDGQANHIGKD